MTKSSSRKKSKSPGETQAAAQVPQVKKEKVKKRKRKKQGGEEQQGGDQENGLPASQGQPRLQPEIQWKNDGALVVLGPGQRIFFDGRANVRLLHGEASMLGFNLLKGQDQLLLSNGQLSSCIAIESPVQEVTDAAPKQTGAPSINLSGVHVKQGETLLKVQNHLLGPTVHAASPALTFTLEAEGSPLAQPGPDLDAPKAKRQSPEGKYVRMTIDEPAETSTRLQLEPTATSIPRLWREVTSEIVDSSQGELAPIVLVCGGKNVGKSTYARFLVNSLLNRYPKVAFLETDTGQPEFTVPGLLSLHILEHPVLGPPSMHLKDPYRSFFYGDISPKSDPNAYLQGIVALYDAFRKALYDVEKLPLVINTHGWVKGLGLDVLIDLLRYAAPSHVVQVQSPSASKNLPPGTFWAAEESATILRYVPGAPEGKSSPRSAPEERSSRILSCLQAATGAGLPSSYPYSEAQAYAAVAQALAHHRPYQVPLDSLRILHLHAQVPPAEAFRAINGALVGLASSSGGDQDGQVLNQPGPLCLGIGLVRSVDTGKGVLYMVTTVQLDELQRVDTLIQGKIDVPLQMLQAPPYAYPYLSFNSVSTEGTGSATIRSRNNLLRKSGEFAALP